MNIANLIITILNLISICVFLYIYIHNQKKDKIEQQKRLDELSQTVSVLHVKTESQINNILERILSDNTSSSKELKEKISFINNSFDEYSKKVQMSLSKYSEENLETKKSSNQLKEDINKGLANLLSEIKAPLDLD